MPLPTPSSGEQKKAFLDRCMGNSVAVSEFPDAGQRFKVCESQFAKKRGYIPAAKDAVAAINHFGELAAHQQQMAKKRGKTMDIERRTIPKTMVEIREAKGEPTKLVGRAVPYNVLSRDLGGFKEQFSPGAFDDVLKDSDVRALFNHNPDHLLGRESAGTLELRDGMKGLDYTVDPLPKTSVAKDVAENVRLGNIQGNSFSFSVAEGGDVWEKQEDGTAIRTVIRVSALYDVGPVTEPAYDKGTKVSARSVLFAWQTVWPVPMNLVRAKQEAMERRHPALR